MVRRTVWLFALAAALFAGSTAAWFVEEQETVTNPGGVDTNGDGLPDPITHDVVRWPYRVLTLPMALAGAAVAAVAGFLLWRARPKQVPADSTSKK